MAYQALIPSVAKAFGLNYVSASIPQKGYRNESYRLTLTGGEEVNLMFHKNEREALERIKAADQASDFLSQSGLPVRARFDTRTLKISDGRSQVYAGIYTYLPGKTIPWEAYTMNHIKLLGWAMSDMHRTWGIFDTTSGTYITDELRTLLDRMERYFADPSVSRALKDKLHISVSANFYVYRSLLGQFDRVLDPEEHILHMDLVRGNVLFGSNRESPWQIGSLSISGIIDFEKAATGHRVFDIARTLAFLLVDCATKDRSSVFKYFLQSGYNKRGGDSFRRNSVVAGLPAGRVLNMLIGFFLLHDFYKFLRHTPYESLEQNHHFVRTRDILIDYGMIRLSKD